MIRLTLHSLWSHKRRFIATAVSVVLGVAFMAGTLVLTSTLNRVFDDLFAGLGDGIDAQIRGEVLFETDFAGDQRGLIDEGILDDVAAVPGVAHAEGFIANFGLSVLDPEGEVMGGSGAPTIVGNWEYDQELASYNLVEGRAPETAGEVVIDMAASRNGPFALGDQLELLSAEGRESMTVVGLSRFGEADSAAGSIYVATTLPEAQRLAGEPGKLQTIAVRAEPGISPEDMVQRLTEAELFAGADIVTGQEAADEMAGDVKEGLGFFSMILSIFAAIALFVGWFVISNTFSILVAQRTRELALLRAVGASRRQVLTSVLLEGWIIGLFSAVLGFLAGVGLAGAAMAALRGLGLDLPSASLVITPTVAVVAILLGLFITTIAAFMPAIRATRVPPIAALRDVALDRSGRSKIRLGVGLLALVIGLISIIPAFGDDPTTDDLPGVGTGMALVVASVLLLAPSVARPLAQAVGLLVKGLIAIREAVTRRVRGADSRNEDAHEVVGQLARENAMRNPGRTASTASALIIGVTLIGFITIFAASAQTSITTVINDGFKGDYIIQPASQMNFTGVSPELAEELAEVDGVQTVSTLSIILGQATTEEGRDISVLLGGIDPSTFDLLFTSEMAEGSLADLSPEGLLVDRQIAAEYEISMGDRIEIVATGGRTETFTVEGLSDDQIILGTWTVSSEAAARLTPTRTDAFMALLLEDGVSVDSIRPELETVVDEYPTMRIQDQDEFAGSIISQISALLNVIYALLAVSVVIAVIGIANTLSLSIHERTRELGLLRAMGMTRNQLRASVRWEAVIVALIGTAAGLVLSLALSWTLVKALVSQGFANYEVPMIGMAVVVLFGAGLGVVASVWPAYRASKLNVLEAIDAE